MSLRIDTEKVKAVLLSDGEWYQCRSFRLDSYDFMGGDGVGSGDVDQTGGQDRPSAASKLGFLMEATIGSSLTKTRLIAGPVSSILAVEQES